MAISDKLSSERSSRSAVSKRRHVVDVINFRMNELSRLPLMLCNVSTSVDSCKVIQQNMSSYSFKVVLLGQGCVGKTSLVLRYVSNVFNDVHQSNQQASFLKKQLYLDRDLIRLNIWDTAGQERYHALGPIYYRDSNGAILVYDVTNPDSLRKVRDWVKELNKMRGVSNIKLAIVGNKTDLLEQKLLLTTPLIQEAIQFTDELSNAKHYLTSAKLNQGISDLFVGLSKTMVGQHRHLLAVRSNKSTHPSRLNNKTLSIEGEESYDEDQADGRRSSSVRLGSSGVPGGRSCQC